MANGDLLLAGSVLQAVVVGVGGIARERDQQLVEKSFEQWRETHFKNAKQDGRHLGKKELKLGRILDGQEIAKLYQAREDADQQKESKHQQKQPIKPSRSELHKVAASSVHISGDSSSNYETEGESTDSSDSHLSTIIVRAPKGRPPLYMPTSGSSKNSSSPCSQRQLSIISAPSTDVPLGSVDSFLCM